MQLSNRTRNWLEQKLLCKISDAEPLLGGTSSRLWLMTLDQQATTRKGVLREYTNQEWLKLEPEIAEREAQNLRAASHLSVKTPEVLTWDPYAKKTTHPTIVMSYVEGEVVLDPANQTLWIEELAKTLAQLHRNNLNVPHQYFRYFVPDKGVKADWSDHPELWQKAFDLLKQSKHLDTEQTFIHRDYHPTNVLFKDTKVSGVIDWPNACMGPKEVDVAHCRWNLTMLFGLNIADEFLENYLKHSTLQTYDPYWDLEALGNVFTEEAPGVYQGWEAFGKKDLTPALMRERMDRFLVQAIDKINE